MRWWKEIGFKKPDKPQNLLLFLPCLVLIIGNLTFGIHVTDQSMLTVYVVTALLSGFVEETAFRGFILRAFKNRGLVYAVIASSLLFGLTHIFNIFAGEIVSIIYIVVFTAYSIFLLRGINKNADPSGKLTPAYK